jgi:translocation protein SEC62
MATPTPPPVNIAPGQQPTQEQIQQIQQHFRDEAQRMGISYEEYIEKVKEQAMAQQKAQMEAQQQQQQQQQQEPIQPGPPKPEALAVAKFLRAQDLKPRTCIFQEKRKELFRGTLQSIPLCISVTRNLLTF